jgi:hypothetical protein
MPHMLARPTGQDRDGPCSARPLSDSGRILPDEEVLELVDHSYDLVLAGLTRAQRSKLMT